MSAVSMRLKKQGSAVSMRLYIEAAVSGVNEAVKTGSSVSIPHWMQLPWMQFSCPH
jgi:hypothetical protein